MARKQYDPYASLRSYSSTGQKSSSSYGGDPYKALAAYKTQEPSDDEKKAQKRAELQQKLKDQQKNKGKSLNLADIASKVVKGGKKLASTVFEGTEKVGDSIEALTGGFDRKNAKIDAQEKSGAISHQEAINKRNAILNDIKWAGTKDKGTGDRLRKSGGVSLQATAELAPIPIGKAAKGASLTERLVKGGAAGAVAGGIHSAGQQLEEGKASAPKTLADIALGGAFGAVGAGAAGSRTAQRALKAVKDKVPFVHADDGIYSKVKSMGDKSLHQKTTSVMDDAKKSLIDSNQPLNDFSKAVEGQLGRKLSTGENPYQLNKLRGGIEGQAVTHLEDTAGWMKHVPDEVRQDGDIYGYAKQYLSQADKRTPEQIKWAQNAIDHLNKKYEGDLTPLDTYTQKTRETFDTLVDAYQKEGMISDAHANALRANPDYFAKMEVLQDDTGKFLRNGGSINTKEASALKGIKGQSNDAQLAPAAESYVKATTNTMHDIANNRVGRSLGDLADQLGENNGLIHRLPNESADIPKGTTRITYLNNGEKNFLAVPKEIGDILTGADKQTYDIVTRTVGKLHNMFRQAVTTYNPLFVFMRNPVRDFKSFLTNSRNVPVHRALLDYSTALFDSLAEGKWKKEFIRAGGGQAGYFSREGGQAGKQIAKAAKDITGKRTVAGRIVTSPRDFMQYMSEAIENAPRVAEYRAGIKKGLSPQEAAVHGREVTVDFAQGGSAGRVMNQWIPFLNARAQGVRRSAQAFRENPARALTVFGATSALPIATMMAWNHQFPNVWNNIPDYEKESNFIFVLGNGQDASGKYNQIIKIPKGDVDKILGNTFESMLDNFMNKQQSNGKQFASSLLNAASNISPISFANNGQFSGSSLLSNVLPPVAKAPTEAISNYSFFKDQPIVPENMQGAPLNEQAFANTSQLARLLGSKFNMSPLKMDNTINNLMGSIPKDMEDALLNRSLRPEANKMGGSLTSAAGGKAETEFWKVYSPAKQTKDYREKQFYSLIDQGKYKEAQRKADEYNRDIDKRFSSYFQTHGAYMPKALGSPDDPMDPMDLIDNLKINVVISKKGKPYIKR